jgi:hypothetical protein
MRLALSVCVVCITAILAPVAPARGAELAQTIERNKPSVVGVGTFLKTRSPSAQFVGTGFAVADGRFVVTNAHTVNRPLDTEKLETAIVLVSKDGAPQPREASLLAVDKEHDLALLKIGGDPLPALKLGDSATVREGQMLAFTGFPIGMVLGFYPATHRGMVAAITPVVTPGLTARQLNAQMINRIRDSAYNVFQLDGTAYPATVAVRCMTPLTAQSTGSSTAYSCRVRARTRSAGQAGSPMRFRANTFVNSCNGKKSLDSNDRNAHSGIHLESPVYCPAPTHKSGTTRFASAREKSDQSAQATVRAQGATAAHIHEMPPAQYGQ